MKSTIRSVALTIIALAARSAAASGLEDAADVLRVALPLYAGAYAWHQDDDKGQREWMVSTVVTLGSTYALKAAISKDRPDGKDDDAFPSGHSAAAFSGAAFLHRRYGPRVAWPAYALAGWTAWSRVQTDDHDSWDVAAGAAVAVTSAWLLATPRADSVTIYPVIDVDSFGLAFSRRF